MFPGNLDFAVLLPSALATLLVVSWLCLFIATGNDLFRLGNKYVAKPSRVKSRDAQQERRRR